MSSPLDVARVALVLRIRSLATIRAADNHELQGAWREEQQQPSSSACSGGAPQHAKEQKALELDEWVSRW